MFVVEFTLGWKFHHLLSIHLHEFQMLSFLYIFLADLPDGIQYPHWASVSPCWWANTLVHPRVRTSLLSSFLFPQYVCFVLLEWFVRWEKSVRTAVVFWRVLLCRICSKEYVAFPCSPYQGFLHMFRYGPWVHSYSSMDTPILEESPFYFHQLDHILILSRDLPLREEK